MTCRPLYFALLVLAGLSGCDPNDAEPGPEDLEALDCSSANLADGGAYPPQVLAELDQRAEQLPVIPLGEAPAGCTIQSYDIDGKLLQADSLNADGQPLERRVYDASGAVSAHTTFTYDQGREVSRLVELTDGGTLSYAWSYTEAGAIRTFSGPYDQYTWDYDDEGRVLGWTQAGVRRVTYAYDGGVVTGYTSDDHAIRGSFEYGAGGVLHRRGFSWPMSSQELEYDSRGRIVRSTVGGAHMGSTAVDFGYDAAGCLASEVSVTVGAPQFPSFVASWRYEAACQLRLFGLHRTGGSDRPPMGVVRRAYRPAGALVLEEADLNADCEADGSHQLLRDAAHVLREEHFTGALVHEDRVVKRTYSGASCLAYTGDSPYPLPRMLQQARTPFPQHWDLFWQLPAF